MALGNLFNNIKEQTGNVSEKLKEGVSEMASASVHHKKLKQLITEKAKMHEFIGMEVFDLYLANTMNMEAVEPFCNKIEALNTEIEELELEISMNSNMCECGAKLQKGVKFCPSCGKSTAKEDRLQSKVQDTTECVCGAVIELGSQMCMECGRRIVT